MIPQFANMTDRELLVQVVTTQDAISEKLDTVIEKCQLNTDDISRLKRWGLGVAAALGIGGVGAATSDTTFPVVKMVVVWFLGGGGGG